LELDIFIESTATTHLLWYGQTAKAFEDKSVLLGLNWTNNEILKVTNLLSASQKNGFLVDNCFTSFRVSVNVALNISVCLQQKS